MNFMRTPIKNRMGAATCFKFMVVLVFMLTAAVPTGSAQCIPDAQTSARPGSVRPDGTLDFVGPDGSRVVRIVIEIAETTETHSRGLMGRPFLRMTDGMLFIFERAELRHFWMKNTPVSLDMIFVDSEKQIVHVAESTLPMSTRTYSSLFPALYVVEVPAGFVKFFNIQAGMRIQWQRR